MVSIARLIPACAIALGLAFGSAASRAQDYPSKPVRLIVPIAAGGLTDTLARMLGTRLGERLGQPVVVENRPGAGGIIGMQAAAKAPADGYSLVFVYQGVASVNMSLYKTLPYDTMRDFAPVAQVATFPLVLVVHPEVKAKNLRELIELARPGSMNYASAGNATTSHLGTELLLRAAGIRMTHVPYKGEAPALTEVAGGTVPVVFSTVTAGLPLIKAGKLRPIAVSVAERSPLLPDVPTIAESGLKDFAVFGWYGVLAPTGTPPAIVARLSRELVAIVSEPEMRSQMAGRGIDAVGTGSDAFAKLIRDETERWHRVVTDANIKVE